MKVHGDPLPPDVPLVAWPVLSAVADRNPDKDALVTPTERLSFAQFKARVHQAQHLLHDLGMKPGDRLVVLLSNEWHYPVLYWACLATSLVFVPLNVRLVSAEIAPILAEVEPTLIMAEDRFCAQVPQEWSPRLRRFEAMASSLLVKPLTPRLTAPPSPEDAAVILYTSGTTGVPKGVVLSHRNVAAQFYQASHALVEMTPDDRVISLYPLFHTAQHVFLQAPQTIGATTIVDEFHPAQVLDLVRRERVSIFFGVPAMYHILLQNPVFRAENFPDIRMLTYGASIMPRDTIETIRQRFPAAQIRNLYGQTENSPAISGLADAYALTKPGSVGLPLPGMTIAIQDENDVEVGSGVVGEVVTQGINLMLGYFRNPDAFADVVRDGWYHTGDLGYLDAEGFLYIVDRKKDMIIRGGQNIYPAEIENVLYTHPDIVECAVIGVPEPVYGEEVAAIVVARRNSDLTEEMVRRHIKGRVAAYKEPVHVYFTDELPHNASGKILKRELRHHWAPADAEAGDTARSSQ